MTNQQFKDLLESNGIKTREHQFYDFAFGDFGVTKQVYVKDEVSLYIGDKSFSIFFNKVNFDDILVTFLNNKTTIAIVAKRELM